MKRYRSKHYGCKKYNCLVRKDKVYEWCMRVECTHLVYENRIRKTNKEKTFGRGSSVFVEKCGDKKMV